MTDETHREQDEQPATPAEPTEAGDEPTTAPTASEPPPPPPPGDAPPPPGAPPAAPRLVRRTDDKVIAGVCSGLAAYTGTDPVMWRVGAVLLALFGGLAVPAYIVAWLVLPEARPWDVAPPRRPSQDQSKWIAMGAIVFGLVLLFRNVWHFRGGIFWGLVLIGLGVAFWGRDFMHGANRNGGPPVPPVPPVPPTTPSSDDPATWTWAHHNAPTTPGAVPASPTATTPMAHASHGVAAATAVRRREPSILGRLVLGASALAVGFAVLFDNIGFIDVTAKGIVGVLLAIVGTGLVVGAWLGRARWLIFPGLGLALILITVAYVPFNEGGGFGEVDWSPSTLRRVQPTYEHSAGQAVLDLTEVNFGSRARSVDVRLGFGELLVLVPEDINVVVDAEIQGGQMMIFGQVDDGWDIEETVESAGAKNSGPLRLHTQVTFGELTVQRGRPADFTGFRRNNGGPMRFRFDNNNN